jgi:catechol 2,3-dioxygenase-like lactoylglutathione lyase family enzyme
VQLFHYHLVTSKVREVEARYIGKLGFRLVARYGRIGEEQVHYEAGTGWPELDELGFKLRLSELERGAVNVVVQPGQWEIPRVDHVGVALEEEEFDAVMERANQNELRVQEYPGRRTFIATGVGYRLEIHPQRDWIEDLLAESKELRLAELHLRADEPKAKAAALMQILDLQPDVNEVQIGETLVRFLPNGPQGRPQLESELFA